jgi:anaerobic selenocysteine-containing dehydrogenase
MILTALADRWFSARALQGSPEVGDVTAAGLAEGSGATPERVDWKRKARKARQSPTAKPWNYATAQAVLEEIGKAVSTYDGMRWESLGLHGLQWSAGARPVRRVEVVDPEPIPELPADAYRLVTGPLLREGGVLMQHGADEVRRLIPEPFVALDPADAAKAGLTDGNRVALSSEHATVTLVVRTDGTVQPRTAWVPAGLAGLPAEALGADLGEPVVATIERAPGKPEQPAADAGSSADTPAEQAVQD